MFTYLNTPKNCLSEIWWVESRGVFERANITFLRIKIQWNRAISSPWIIKLLLITQPRWWSNMVQPRDKNDYFNILAVTLFSLSNQTRIFEIFMSVVYFFYQSWHITPVNIKTIIAFINLNEFFFQFRFCFLFDLHNFFYLFGRFVSVHLRY